MNEARIADALKEIEERIAAVNVAIKGGKFNEVNLEMDKLAAAEKLYAGLSAQKTYEELATTEKPLVEAAKKYEYPTIGHEVNKVNGVTVSVSKKDTTKKIDLLDFCKTQGLPTDWQYEAEKACQLFVLDTAIDLGFTPEQVKSIADSIYLSKATARYYASKEDSSLPDPTSNNSLNKALNEVIKMTIGEDYHSSVYDVKYVRRVFNKKGKAGLVLACGKPSYFRQIMLDILYRLVTGSTYGIAFDMKDAEGKRREGVLFSAAYSEGDPAPAPAKPGKSGKKSGKNSK